MTRTGVVPFTRDLRVHDQPALVEATRECDLVLPLFVFDDRLLGSASRVGFLLDGDLASDAGNWQWVAGTGMDTRLGTLSTPHFREGRHDRRLA
jgi:deoxyribodipyrimidine photolyase